MDCLRFLDLKKKRINEINEKENLLLNENDITLPSYDEWQCPICLCLMLEPAILQCSHRFCLSCIEDLLNSSANEDDQKCPMCRERVPINYSPHIDRPLQEIINSNFPKEFIEKTLFVNRMKLSNNRKKIKKLKFQFGNSHHQSTDKNNKSVHTWTVFFKLPNDEIQKYVEKVEFVLHPSYFKPNEIVVKEAPFSVTREGWGVFNVPIKIFWKKWLQQEPTILQHYLSFFGFGETKTYSLSYSVNLSLE